MPYPYLKLYKSLRSFYTAYLKPYVTILFTAHCQAMNSELYFRENKKYNQINIKQNKFLKNVAWTFMMEK